MDPDQLYRNWLEMAGLVKGSRVYWSITLYSGNAVVSTKMSVGFGSYSKRTTQHCLDCDRLNSPNNFLKRAEWKVAIAPPNNINEHWPLIKNVLHSDGLVCCGSTRRVVTPWICTNLSFSCSPVYPRWKQVAWNTAQRDVDSTYTWIGITRSGDLIAH